MKNRRKQIKEEKRQAHIRLVKQRRKDLTCQFNELVNLVHPINPKLSQINILKKGN